MNARLSALAGNVLAPTSRDEVPRKAAREQAGNFGEHLQSAEKGRAALSSARRTANSNSGTVVGQQMRRAEDSRSLPSREPVSRTKSQSTAKTQKQRSAPTAAEETDVDPQLPGSTKVDERSQQPTQVVVHRDLGSFFQPPIGSLLPEQTATELNDANSRSPESPTIAPAISQNANGTATTVEGRNESKKPEVMPDAAPQSHTDAASLSEATSSDSLITDSPITDYSAPDEQAEVTSPGREGNNFPENDSDDSAARLADDQTPGPTGTASAKEMLLMNKAVQTDEFAERAVKNLPGAERTRGGSDVRFVNRETEGTTQVDASLLHSSLTATHSRAAATSTESLVATSGISPAERVARAVLDGVAQLRHSGNDSVSVVLKPDAGTEILLRVEMRDGALSAHLQFERGDRSFLDRHAEELQQRLAEQGVRLNLGDNGARSDQSERRPAPPENDLSLAGSVAAPKETSRQENISRLGVSGFETWA